MWRDWEKKTLGELADINMGQSPDSSSVSEDNRKGMPFLQGNAEFGVKFPTPHLYCTQPKKKCSEGDFLISVRAPVGALNVANQNYCIGRGLAALKVPKEKSGYLWHALNNFAPELAAVSQGSTFDAINSNNLAELEFHLPKDENEQKSIAEVLDTVDEAIAATQAMLDKQDKIKDGLLQDLLTRGVDANGKLRPAYKDAPDLYKQSPLGFIPKEWDAETINNMAIHVSSGVTPRGGSNVYRKSGITFIRSQNVYNDGLKLEDVAFISSQIHSDMSSSEIFPHDVLLNITGASIGRCCPVPESLGRANVNQHVCAIRLANVNKDDAKFLAMTLASFVGQDQIARFNAGSNREGLNYQQIRSFDIPWPKSEERKLIAATYQSYQEQKNNTISELIKLKKLKAGLMQDLLTGKKRISKNQREAA